MNDKLAWQWDGPPDNANLRMRAMRAMRAIPARTEHRRQKRPRW